MAANWRIDPVVYLNFKGCHLGYAIHAIWEDIALPDEPVPNLPEVPTEPAHTDIRLPEDRLILRLQSHIREVLPVGTKNFIVRNLPIITAIWTTVVLFVGATTSAIYEDIVQEFWKAEVVSRLVVLNDPVVYETTLGSVIAIIVSSGILILLFLALLILLSQDNKWMARDIKNLYSQHMNMHEIMSGLSHENPELKNENDAMRINASSLKDELEEAKKNLSGGDLREFLATLDNWFEGQSGLLDDWDKLTKVDRDNRLSSHLEMIMADCDRIWGGEILIGSSVGIPSKENPDRLMIFCSVGVDERRKSVRRFYIGDREGYSQERGVAGHAYRARTLKICNDIFDPACGLYSWTEGDTRPKSLIPYRAIAASPIYLNDEVIGVLCLDGRNAYCFDRDDVELVMQYACRNLGRLVERFEASERDRGIDNLNRVRRASE